MHIDTTTFLLFGLLPPYIFFAGVGALAGFFSFNILLVHLKSDVKLGNRAVVFSLPALFIGAKLFGIIANVSRDVGKGIPITKDTFIHSSIIFYGGLLFFISTFLLLTRRIQKSDRNTIIDSLCASIPLFHMFGRLGCFFAGCCYGIVVSDNNFFSVNYTNIINDEIITQYRFPVQLLEASVNFFIFIILFLLVYKQKAKGNIIYLYFLLYSTLRFLDEFLRGDSSVVAFGLSVAQIISVLLFALAIIFYLFHCKKTRRNLECITQKKTK